MCVTGGQESWDGVQASSCFVHGMQWQLTMKGAILVSLSDSVLLKRGHVLLVILAHHLVFSLLVSQDDHHDHDDDAAREEAIVLSLDFHLKDVLKTFAALAARIMYLSLRSSPVSAEGERDWGSCVIVSQSLCV